jgi:uncharacterized membrane protein YgdD (TMEM256/DUF423 family)
MKSRFVAVGCLMCALAVALGAFGAHGLKAHLSADQLQTWRTANNYLFLHGLAVIALANLKPLMTLPLFGFVIGALLFCLSLFALVAGAPSWLGIITPLGGMTWIASWLILSYRFLKLKDK